MIGGELLTRLGSAFPAYLLRNVWRFMASVFRRSSTASPQKLGDSTQPSTAPSASPTRKRTTRSPRSGSSAVKSSTPKSRRSKERQ